MDHKDLCEHTRIRLIAAAVGHQQCTKTESNIVPIPGGERVIAIGTPAQVRGLLLDLQPAAPTQAAPIDRYMDASIELDAATDNFYGQAPRVSEQDERALPTDAEMLQALRNADRLLRAAGFAMNGTCSSKIVEAINKHASTQAAQSSGVPATNAEIYTLRRVIECAKKLNERPRPMCRDCADEDGTCPNSGLECDMPKLFADAKALHNKLAAHPAPSAAPAQGDQSIDGQLIGIASPVKVATVVSRVGDDLRVGWLRPEQCEVGTNLYAIPVAQGTPVHFYRQRGIGGQWIECDTDPRERFANSPAALCMEYRTLSAAAPAPSQQANAQSDVVHDHSEGGHHD